MTTLSRRPKAFEPEYDEWLPPEELLIALHDPSLKTRDKVELIIGVYAVQHRGLHPSAEKIHRVLGLCKTRVETVMTELIAAGRAEKLHGKFVLKRGVYQNPVVSEVLAELGYDTSI